VSFTRALIRSHMRVTALADVNHRYAAIVVGLSDAIANVLPRVDAETRAQLEDAIATTDAQLVAITDALDVAMADGLGDPS
jgi:hypothetical protein